MDKINILKSDKKRLHVLLDKVNFEKLDNIKARHGDSTYTQALKRAIVLQAFIDKQIENGDSLFLSNDNGKTFFKVKEVG